MCANGSWFAGRTQIGDVIGIKLWQKNGGRKVRRKFIFLPPYFCLLGFFRYEHFRAIHSSSGGYRTVDYRYSTGGNGRLPATPGGAVAAGGLSDHLGPGVVAWSEPRDHGVIRRGAARTATWPHRRCKRNDLRQLSRLN